MELVNSKDFEIVSRQLGRKIKNRFWVVKRCKYGYPMVVKTDPIGPMGPFPTLFWLTCPFLRREIGKFESMGYIRKYQNLLKTNRKLMCEYLLAHRKTREIKACKGASSKCGPFRSIIFFFIQWNRWNTEFGNYQVFTSSSCKLSWRCRKSSGEIDCN